VNKFSGIFQNNGRQLSTAASQEPHDTAARPNEDQVATVEPRGVERVGSSPKNGVHMTFQRARSLLAQTSASVANSFVALLQNPATPPEILRKTLEEVIEYRSADSVLAKAEDDDVLRDSMMKASVRVLSTPAPERTDSNTAIVPAGARTASAGHA
jgi:hypothetical protein